MAEIGGWNIHASSGANLPAAAQQETKMVMDATYQGACPATVQPKAG